MKELKNLLEKYGFYNEADEIEEVMKYKEIQLVKKSNGDSYEAPLDIVFGDDYGKFMELVNKFELKCPDTVWYD